MKTYPRFLLNIAAGLATATALSLTTSGLAFWSMSRTNTSNQLAQETLETINRLTTVIQNVQDAESGQRGYLLTQNRAYLEPYINATLNLEQELGLLKNHINTHVDQQERFSELESLINQRMAQFQQVINLQNQQGSEAARAQVIKIQGNLLTEQIRRTAQEMKAIETAILLQQQQRATSNAQGARVALSGAVGLNLLIFIWLYWLIQQEVLKRNRAEQSIQELNENLEHRVVERTEQLEETLRDLQKVQSQLVQQEKMSSLGQLVAGVAHEINNPVNFIHGNLTHVEEYAQDLLSFVQLYQQHYPHPVVAIQAEAEEIDLKFLQADLPKMLASMKMGTDRIRQIVLSLRNFSRMDEAEFKVVDIHEGIESTLMILQHRLKARAERPEIEIVREYGSLPLVECFAGQLNQVFMNILANAIDALDEVNAQRTYQEIKTHPSRITLRTSTLNAEWVEIAISDNGPGMPEPCKQRIFNPFFTTKPAGKGTGMGMSISYQIITEKHQGRLKCFSTLGQGSEFVIQIPIQQNVRERA